MIISAQKTLPIAWFLHVIGIFCFATSTSTNIAVILVLHDKCSKDIKDHYEMSLKTE